MFIRVSIASYLLFLAVVSADAQIPRYPYGVNPGAGTPQQRQQQLQQQQLQQAMTAVDVSGTIGAVAPGRIQVLSDSNENWIIALSPKTKVQVSGEASADFLRPGMFVQLKAEVDKRGVAADKIEELTIVTPSQQKTPGVFSKPGGEGVTPDGFPAGKAAAGGSSTVRGKIASIKKNKLQIQVDKGMVICELSDNPKISIDLADYSMARIGDKIKAQCLKMAGASGPVQAMQVKIDLAGPLGEKKKK
jgi:preprotein translocase subunit YajC